MKTVYLVRHGETTYNQDQLVQDGTSELTLEGKRQALVLAERLQNLKFSNLIVSDYIRTKQTAEPIAKLCKVEPIYTHLFREVRRPSKFFHLSRNDPEFRKFLLDERENLSNQPNWRHSDEETFTDVRRRMQESLKYLLDLPGDHVVVSHGNYIRHLVAMVATGEDLTGDIWQKLGQTFWATNTGITVFQYNDETALWRILTFNDHAHFAE